MRNGTENIAKNRGSLKSGTENNGTQKNCGKAEIYRSEKV
jgi:hypothetical protein